MLVCFAGSSKPGGCLGGVWSAQQCGRLPKMSMLRSGARRLKSIRATRHHQAIPGFRKIVDWYNDTTWYNDTIRYSCLHCYGLWVTSSHQDRRGSLGGLDGLGGSEDAVSVKAGEGFRGFRWHGCWLLMIADHLSKTWITIDFRKFEGSSAKVVDLWLPWLVSRQHLLFVGLYMSSTRYLTE